MIKFVIVLCTYLIGEISKNMVIVRMGEASNLGNTFFDVSGFDRVLWEKINAVIN